MNLTIPLPSFTNFDIFALVLLVKPHGLMAKGVCQYKCVSAHWERNTIPHRSKCFNLSTHCIHMNHTNLCNVLCYATSPSLEEKFLYCLRPVLILLTFKCPGNWLLVNQVPLNCHLKSGLLCLLAVSSHPPLTTPLHTQISLISPLYVFEYE